MPNSPSFVEVLKQQPHCKPKPCKTYRELPISQFPQGKTCFDYRGALFSLQGPCSHYRVSLYFPVLPCMGLQCGIVKITTLDLLPFNEVWKIISPSYTSLFTFTLSCTPLPTWYVTKAFYIRFAISIDLSVVGTSRFGGLNQANDE